MLWFHQPPTELRNHSASTRSVTHKQKLNIDRCCIKWLTQPNLLVLLIEEYCRPPRKDTWLMAARILCINQHDHKKRKDYRWVHMGNTRRPRERERERGKVGHGSLCWVRITQADASLWENLSLSLSLSGVKSIRAGCSSLYSTGTSGKLSPALLWIHAVKHKAELLLQTQTKTQSEAWIDDASKKAWAGFILLELIFRNNSMTLDFHKLH